MSPNSRRTTVIIVVLLLLALLALLLVRCSRADKPAPAPEPAAVAPTAAEPTQVAASTPPPADSKPEEFTPATLQAPKEVGAGTAFAVAWTGPDNAGDYVTMVAPHAAESTYGNYVETKQGRTIEFTAPVDAGDYELRYVTGRSRKVLGRLPMKVLAAAATITAPESAVLGTTISVNWTGPSNPRDYLTVVAKNTPDGQYANYTETVKGSPLTLKVPVEPGDAEIRYMTGQGGKVLGRRDIKVLMPEVALEAPAEVVAGTKFPVEWKGPNNPGDYVTVVSKGTPDGRYDKYVETAKGPKLDLTALITPGEAELRYMTGTGSRVLARRPITIVAATITLDAPADAVAGAAVPITWTGPNNAGDYITIVREGTKDGQYARYADTGKGSPLKVEAPIDAGPAEIRYMSGQGAKVLSRRLLHVTAPEITLKAPPRGAPGATVQVEWTGPNNAGDYLTIVPKDAKDGATQHTVQTSRGSPASIRLPKTDGPVEIRYLSGQGNRVLARTDIEAAAE